MPKEFLLSAEQIQPLVEGEGYCFATDSIVVNGQKVGYCYREGSTSEHDSGWRFFSGDDSQEYVENPNNLGIYDVNTIANYDMAIISILSAPVGSAYERCSSNTFKALPFTPPVEA